MSFQAGTLIGGRYRLEELIGSGGMGEVFRARDTVLERPVALKLVEAVDPRRREEITTSFLREARISAAIAHRNVVRILDFGTHDNTTPFMVMELLEGESLAHVLGRGDELSFEWILALATQVLDGLSAAHDAGVVHRDLKPENIFLVEDRDGAYPKILDFGISKILDSTGTAHVTTTQGHVVGTPAYMSPEQARGVKQIDTRTDLYSMGVVLYELLTGEMPFLSENPGDMMVMIMTAHETPLSERVPELGEPLSDLVGRAMAKSPDDRFETAQDMQNALFAVTERMLGSAAVERLSKRIRPASWRMGPSDTGGVTGQPQAIAPTHTPLRARSPLPMPAARKRRLSRRWLVMAMSVGGAAFALGLISFWFGRPSAASAPRFIVVRGDPPRAQEPAPSIVLTPPVPAQLDPPSDAEALPARPRTTPSSSAPRSTAELLADSFRSQKTGVVACVNTYTADVERTPKLAVRFSLAANGTVERAQVLPADLGHTEMGTCIESAARSMRFPKQAGPIAFEVPLTARKGG